jgi:transcriptional regulator with XRE-family HTH domain
MKRGLTRGDRLRYWRERREMTLMELADLVGIHFSVISKLELGHREFRADEVEAFARALSVPVDEFFVGLSTPPTAKAAG